MPTLSCIKNCPQVYRIGLSPGAFSQLLVRRHRLGQGHWRQPSAAPASSFTRSWIQRNSVSTSATMNSPSISTQVPRRGAFIAIEGLDRAGKTTQCQLLAERFEREGIPIKLQKFPDRTTPIGKMIDGYLRSGVSLEDHAIHLLFSANRWELCEDLKATLATGTTILLDRYVHSGIVFTAAKGLPFSWCQAPELGLPKPDKVIFLDISEKDAAERGGYGEERYEKREIQDRVRKLFAEVRKAEGDDWVVVDAGKGLDIVAEEMWSAAKKVVGEVSDQVGVYRG